MKRRDFLALALAHAMLAAARARAAAKTSPANLFEIEKVGIGVYAAVARPQTILNCNAAIFENERDLLIVDAHSQRSAVAALVAQLRQVVGTKPVRYVVNTHFHADHTQGTAAYRKIAPRADVVSSTVTRELIAERGPASARAALENLPRELEAHRRALENATSTEGKAHLEKLIADTLAYMEELRNYAPELPNITFDRNLILHGKHELCLAFCGRAHTAGDIVVFSPYAKVIATGDLLHGFPPFIGDGYPCEWPGTLKSLAEFRFEHVIGGHGGVQHTRERLAQLSAYIEELTAEVIARRARGNAIDGLERDITPATLGSLQAGGYGAFIAAQLIRYDAGYATKRPPEVLAAVVRNGIRETIKALDSNT